LLYCEKDAESIKECVRRNEHVSITLYRENNQFVTQAEPRHISGNESRGMPLAALPLAAAHSRS
jgi:hypothetical protein